jgi:site-specific recombinase XerD
VAALAKHFRRSPDELNAEEVRSFVLHLVEERKLAAASVCTYIAAFQFFYEVTVERPDVSRSLVYPKRPEKLPEILGRSEMEWLLACVSSLRHLCLFMLCYGAGLRASEACRLQVGDIDRARMLIHVRGGKGDKDRYVVLSARLLAALERYWRKVRPPLPYFFPGRTPGQPITRQAVHKALKEVVKSSGLTKHVSPHSLRHAFATHLLEDGTSLRVIQRMMGHSSIRTTARYAQVTALHVSQVRSPLDVPVKESEPELSK